MRIAIRADSSPTIGTGHVMRCLTLSEELIARGHYVKLFTSEIQVPWLKQKISEMGIEMDLVEESSLSIMQFSSFHPDWVVIDSYVIPETKISALTQDVKTLAVVDLDSRGIMADLYLDQNLNSEDADRSGNVSERILAGSKYSLIRNKILSARRTSPWKFNQLTPNILCVMGGSDPTGAIVQISAVLSRLSFDFTATIVCSPQWRAEVDNILCHDPRFKVVEPTIDIEVLYAEADIAVSAAGSSAWEICSLGIPSILIAVADNQQLPLIQIDKAKLALTLDQLVIGKEEFKQSLFDSLTLLLEDETVRESLSRNSLTLFDGKGKTRVVQALEKIA